MAALTGTWMRVIVFALVVAGAACAREAEATPTPTQLAAPTPTLTPYVTSTPRPPATPLPPAPAPTVAALTPLAEVMTPTPAPGPTSTPLPSPTRTPVPPGPTPEGPPRLEARLTASDGGALDHFGWSVDTEGDTIIVGAPVMGGEGGPAGAAYVFRKTGETWTEEAKIVARDVEDGNWFGVSVAIGGNTAVVGAPRDQERGHRAGAAYVFVRGESGWMQQAKLLGQDTTTGDEFGVSVAIHGDTVAVGAPLSGPRNDAPGAAYIFRWDGITWVQEARLTGIDSAPGDLFGTSVAVYQDTAVVGAELGGHNCPYDVIDDAVRLQLQDSGVQQPSASTQVCNAGTVYVFSRNGTAWSQRAKLIASTPATDSLFGKSVAIEGGVIAVGAYRSAVGGRSAGSVYVFSDMGGLWGQVARLAPSNAANNMNFGYVTDLSDGQLAVGAFGAQGEGPDAGAVFLFGQSSNDWGRVEVFQPSPRGALGTSVAIDGDLIVAGAPLEDDFGPASGAVYVFR